MSIQEAQVSRADFDQVMVPNYAPAGFVPVRGAAGALSGRRI